MKQRMRSWMAGLVCVAFVAGGCVGSSPETASGDQAAVQGNGWRVNGWKLNGWTTNGWTTNGWTTNHWRLNGWRVNGWRLNGWRVNGWKLNGWSGDGLKTDGITVDSWPEFHSLSFNGTPLPLEGDGPRVMFGFLSVIGAMSLTQAAEYMNDGNHVLGALMESPAISNIFGKAVGCALPAGQSVQVRRLVCKTTGPVDEGDGSSGGVLDSGVVAIEPKSTETKTTTDGKTTTTDGRTSDTTGLTTTGLTGDGKTTTGDGKDVLATEGGSASDPVSESECRYVTDTYEGSIGVAPWWAEDTLASGDLDSGDYNIWQELNFAPPSGAVSNCIMALYDAQAQVPVSLRRPDQPNPYNTQEWYSGNIGLAPGEVESFSRSEVSAHNSNLFGDPSGPLELSGNVCNNMFGRDSISVDFEGFGRLFRVADYMYQFSDLAMIPSCDDVNRASGGYFVGDPELGWDAVDFDYFVVNTFLSQDLLEPISDQEWPCPMIEDPLPGFTSSWTDGCTPLD